MNKSFLIFVMASCNAAMALSCASPAGSPLRAGRNVAIEMPAGDRQVDVADTTLVDSTRERNIALRIYTPRAEGRVPLIVFSHGLGSSREGFAYLGMSWAARGYVVVHLQHPDSDSSLNWLQLYRAAYDRLVFRNRPLDVTFLLDQLMKGGPDPVLSRAAARIDFDHVGVGGHSYGAYTVLVVAGGLIEVEDGKRISLQDRRVDAIVALSSPRMKALTSREAYAPITLPVLHMTGTKDSSWIFRTRPHHRRIPFESITHARQYLVTMEGAMHGSFSERTERAPEENLERYHAEIVKFTNAFWDAFLKNDDAARNSLTQLESSFSRVEVALGTAF